MENSPCEVIPQRGAGRHLMGSLLELPWRQPSRRPGWAEGRQAKVECQLMHREGARNAESGRHSSQAFEARNELAAECAPDIMMTQPCARCGLFGRGGQPGLAWSDAMGDGAGVRGAADSGRSQQRAIPYSRLDSRLDSRLGLGFHSAISVQISVHTVHTSTPQNTIEVSNCQFACQICSSLEFAS